MILVLFPRSKNESRNQAAADTGLGHGRSEPTLIGRLLHGGGLQTSRSGKFRGLVIETASRVCGAA
jgi:hypothetical protein